MKENQRERERERERERNTNKELGEVVMVEKKCSKTLLALA